MKRAFDGSVLLLFVACSPTDPKPTHTSFQACEDISLACHNPDVATDAAADGSAGAKFEECHRLAHLSTEEKPCLDRKKECVDFCLSDGGSDQ